MYYCISWSDWCALTYIFELPNGFVKNLTSQSHCDSEQNILPNTDFEMQHTNLKKEIVEPFWLKRWFIWTSQSAEQYPLDWIPPNSLDPGFLKEGFVQYIPTCTGQLARGVALRGSASMAHCQRCAPLQIPATPLRHSYWSRACGVGFSPARPLPRIVLWPWGAHFSPPAATSRSDTTNKCGLPLEGQPLQGWVTFISYTKADSGSGHFLE